MKHNLGESYSYRGYDVVNWSGIISLIDKDCLGYFTNLDILEVDDDIFKQADVFIFPKSIGDIGEEVVDILADKIAATDKDRVFFLNSFVTKEYKLNDAHVNLFRIIDEKLISSEAGFTSKDNVDKTFYRSSDKDKVNEGLRAIDKDFVYPDQFKNICDSGDCKHSNECAVTRSPILTNQFMDYQIIEYSR